MSVHGSVGVIVNSKEGGSFETGKGLQQGDPLSPILFNLVVDVLKRMLQKANNAGLVKGLANDVVDQGIISLQYADDTILFLNSDREMASNMKWLLTKFEQMSGMRLNYHKSELIPMNLGDQEK